MDFEGAKREYLRLKAAYERGEISPERFEQAVYNLRLVDAGGQAWQIGLTSGAWYRKEGSAWVEGTPPEGGTALRADRAFFGAPLWLALAVAGGSVLTVLSAFVLVLYFLSGGGVAPLARVITATPPVAAVLTDTSAAPRSPSPTAGQALKATPTPGGALKPTQTASPLTVTPSPTGRESPPQTPTRTPRTQGLEQAHRVWKSMSYSDFNNRDSLQGEWELILDSYPDNRYDFLSYKNRNGMLMTFQDYLLDILPMDEDSYLQELDIEIEEVFAFPADNNSAYIDFMCRHEDWDNTYSFAISRTEWDLYKYLDSEETLLKEGRTPDDFRAGEWGRLTLRCEDSRVSAWLNGALLTSVEDSDRPVGTWAMTLYMDENFAETSLYFGSHRVFKGSADQVAALHDRYQIGDVYVTLERGLRQEGDLYSLGVTFQNRSGQPLEFLSDQVFLLSADGSRSFVDANPPQNAPQAALRFPFTLKEQAVSGSLYFRRPATQDIHSGLDLIVDLGDFGLGQARFQLPAE